MLLRRLSLLIGLSLFASSAAAFTAPVAVQELRSCQHAQRMSPLAAKGTASVYDKIDAVLEGSDVLAEGSILLHIGVADKNSHKLDYKPGHVVALEVKDSTKDLSEDTKTNGGWMRAPYTISRATESSMDILIRSVGKKSKTLAGRTPGMPLRFGGKFKVPILDGVDKNEAKKIVMISTGVGVGPCIGAIEIALKDSSLPPIALFASYQKADEIVYEDYLNHLSDGSSGKFAWKPIVTSEIGRISSTPDNLIMVSEAIQDLSIRDTHYHLIGNGQMVNEWKAGLKKAGVPDERVTMEQYFNHKAEPKESAIANIASVVSSACAVNAQKRI